MGVPFAGMLAVTGSSWVQTVLIASAVVPPVVAAFIVWYFLRASRRDPDHQRLQQVQAEYEATRRRQGSV